MPTVRGPRINGRPTSDQLVWGGTDRDVSALGVDCSARPGWPKVLSARRIWRLAHERPGYARSLSFVPPTRRHVPSVANRIIAHILALAHIHGRRVIWLYTDQRAHGLRIRELAGIPGRQGDHQ